MYKTILCVLFFSAVGFGQNVQFNDPDLLTYLTTRICVDTDGDGTFDANADSNNDGQIQLSEAQQVVSFSFNSLAHNIQDIGGFENFSNLQNLEISTIDITYLDVSTWQFLESIRLSSTSIDTYVFNNPALKSLRIQNVGFSNPTFDLTNLPNLEYVRTQSNFMTDNLIFGTHNNLEELRILAGTFSSLNLSGMPALKFLTIDEYIGTSLDISNNTLLEEFIFRYTANLTTITGADASSALATIDFIQDDYFNTASNLTLACNNQSLTDVSIRGAKTISVRNNITTIGDLELYFIVEAVTVDNCNFAYTNSSLDGTLFISDMTTDQLSFTNIEGLRNLWFQNLSTTVPLDLATVEVDRITFSSCSFTELNIKNGDTLEQFNSSFDTDIQFICIDAEEMSVVENGYQNDSSPVVIHPYCTFVLGGDYYEVTGDILVDVGSGCATYTNGPIFDVQFTVTDGMSTDIFYSSSANDFYYTLPEGNHVLSSQLVNLDLWNITPASVNLSFPTDPSPVMQDFCIVPNGTADDVEITIIPVTVARPGFEAEYKLVYKNKGNTTISGNANFLFDDNVMNFVTSSPTVDIELTGGLVWNYTNLLPFETREINFTMLMNTPTDPNFPLNVDDILEYTAVANPIPLDVTPDDNMFDFEQTVVNSFDPNDIRCLEGDNIRPDQVGKYVHYLIRFENNGTANAVNVVVKDVLDATKFDINSVVPIYASHDFTTRIVNGNELEFIFENIQLPFDDANNDGYVAFKIKTLPSLVLGDTFSNEADIYFDFNFPIRTNTEITIIEEENLSVTEFNLNNISLFPNPTKGILNIQSKFTISNISIFDINGKLLKTEKLSSTSLHHQLAVDNLSNGMYFLEVQSDNAKQTLKFVKN